MTFLLLSLALIAATVFVIRPAFAADPRLPVMGADGRAIVAIFPAFLLVTLLIGLDIALGAMLALVIKEFGHVVGYRLAGHGDAQFRLVPLPGGPAISSREPGSDLTALFVLLMGPGIGLAPMVAAVALGDALAGQAPGLAHTARAYALAAGAVNFLALLPLWPLPGGRLLRMIVDGLFPRIGALSTAALTAFVIGVSLTLHSMLLLLLGFLGVVTLAQAPATPRRPRLSRAQVRIGFMAYFTTLAAYFMSGAWVIRAIPLGL